jgi:hypothetical protein
MAMSTANSARNRKSASPEKKWLQLLPATHPYAEQANSAIPTDPEIYGSNPNVQYGMGCSLGARVASLWSSAGGRLLFKSGGWLHSIVLNAAEGLPEFVARGFIIGFLADVEKLIPVDPKCIESQVRGIRGFSESFHLKTRATLLESFIRGNDNAGKVLDKFDDSVNKWAVGGRYNLEVNYGRQPAEVNYG